MKKIKEYGTIVGTILLFGAIAFANFYASAWWTNFKMEWFNG